MCPLSQHHFICSLEHCNKSCCLNLKFKFQKQALGKLTHAALSFLFEPGQAVALVGPHRVGAGHELSAGLSVALVLIHAPLVLHLEALVAHTLERARPVFALGILTADVRRFCAFVDVNAFLVGFLRY